MVTVWTMTVQAVVSVCLVTDDDSKRDSDSVDRGRFLFSQLSVLLGRYQGRGHVLFVHREPIRIKRDRTTASNVPEGPPSLEHHLSINVSQSDIITV